MGENTDRIDRLEAALITDKMNLKSIEGITIKGVTPKHVATILLILLFGGGVPSGVIFRGPLFAWFLGPAIEAKAEEIKAIIIPQERVRTDSIINVRIGGISEDVKRIKDILERMPDGRRAAAAIDREDGQRIFKKQNWR